MAGLTFRARRADPMADEETAFEPLEHSEELRLLRAFKDHGVRSIIVGGYAVRFYGRFRPVADLDLVVDPEPDNLDGLQTALGVLGVGNPGAVRELFSRPKPAKWHWRDGFLDHHVDLLSAARPFSFATLRPCATAVDYDDLQLLVIGREHLIAAKMTAVNDVQRPEAKREQDREDLEALIAAARGAGTTASE